MASFEAEVEPLNQLFRCFSTSLQMTVDEAESLGKIGTFTKSSRDDVLLKQQHNIDHFHFVLQGTAKSYADTELDGVVSRVELGVLGAGSIIGDAGLTSDTVTSDCTAQYSTIAAEPLTTLKVQRTDFFRRAPRRMVCSYSALIRGTSADIRTGQSG